MMFHIDCWGGERKSAGSLTVRNVSARSLVEREVSTEYDQSAVN